MALSGARPEWLTFDCYGTLIQWDEGFVGAMRSLLRLKGRLDVDVADLLTRYDGIEHELEQAVPFRTFRHVVAESLARSLDAFGVDAEKADLEMLTASISAMPPFPEVVTALRELKSLGYRLCIVSNTEDSVIAGNVAQLGGTIDRVVTAEQAQAYKPSRRIFEYAYAQIGASAQTVLHVCASPLLDLAAARDIGFRCVWVDRDTGRRPPADYTPNVILPNLAALPQLLRGMNW